MYIPGIQHIFYLYLLKYRYFCLQVVGVSLTYAISTATGDAFTPDTAVAFSAFYDIVTHYANEGLIEAEA